MGKRTECWPCPTPCPGSGSQSSGRKESGGRRRRQDCDSLRDHSLPLPIRWSIQRVNSSIWEIQFNSLQFNIHLVSTSGVPGMVSGTGDVHKAITELGTARSALWGPRLIFLVHLIPFVQPLLPGLELGKKEDSRI